MTGGSDDPCPVFTDGAGRRWDLSLNVAVLKRIRSEADVDLLAIIGDDEGRVLRALQDPFTLASILWLVCEDQARAAGVSDEDFARGLIGDSLDDAVAALEAAIVGFSPSRRRAAMRAALAKAKVIEDQAMQRVVAKMDDPQLTERMGAEIDAAIDAAIDPALKGHPGG